MAHHAYFSKWQKRVERETIYTQPAIKCTPHLRVQPKKKGVNAASFIQELAIFALITGQSNKILYTVTFLNRVFLLMCSRWHILRSWLAPPELHMHNNSGLGENKKKWLYAVCMLFTPSSLAQLPISMEYSIFFSLHA